MKKSHNTTSPKISLAQTPTKRNLRWTTGFYGFTGFFGFAAFNAFHDHNPLYLFFLAFFTFFSMFRYWKDPLKWLGVSGVLGLIVPALWAVGLFKV